MKKWVHHQKGRQIPTKHQKWWIHRVRLHHNWANNVLMHIINKSNIDNQFWSDNKLNILNHPNSKYPKQTKWKSRLQLNNTGIFTHTYHKQLINVLIMWNSPIYHVCRLNECPMLISLLRKVNARQASMVRRWESNHN